LKPQDPHPVRTQDKVQRKNRQRADRRAEHAGDHDPLPARQKIEQRMDQDGPRL
jgi:hypothetical protein